MAFSYFHLTCNPFVGRPTPHQVFWSRSQQSTLQRVIHGLEGRQGLIALLGERGIGKKTLLYTYLEQQRQKHLKAISLSGIECSFSTVLDHLCDVCAVSMAETNRDAILDNLRAALSRDRQLGNRRVLILDQAERIPMATLEQLRVLADMKDETGRLLPIILLGSPAFTQHLRRSASAQLKNSLHIQESLAPLTTRESLAYIQHRIACVDPHSEPIFTRGALKRIIRYGQGNPGMLNYLCSETLSVGRSYRQKPISVTIVRKILDDFGDAPPLPWLRWGAVGLAGTAVVVVGLAVSVPKIGAWWQPPKTTGMTGAWPGAEMVSRSRSGTGPNLDRLLPSSTPVLSPPSAPATSPTGVLKTASVPTPSATVRPIPGGRGNHATAPGPNEPALTSPSSAPRTAPSDASETADPGATPTSLPPSSSASGSVADGQRHVASVLCLTARPSGNRGRDIILMDAVGTIRQRLVADGALNLAPILSPDGTRLAYTSYREGTPTVYLRHLTSTQDERITLRSGFALPGSWSPNGRYLALSMSDNGNSDIVLYDTQRRHLRRLTLHAGIDVSPSFAPDNTRVVFTSDRQGASQLYLTDVRARAPRRLSTKGSYNTLAVWAPQGETIAFIGRSPDQTLELYTIRADGTALRRMTTEGQTIEEAPTWAPDGQSIMYTRSHNGMRERRIVRIDGKSDRVLPRHGSVCYSPQWVAQHTD